MLELIESIRSNTRPWPPVEGLNIDQLVWANDAYHGDMNAAHRLHLALLGDGYLGSGYKYTIFGSGRVAVFDVISGATHEAEVPEKEFHGVCVARAWLLAVLKAYSSLKLS